MLGFLIFLAALIAVMWIDSNRRKARAANALRDLFRHATIDRGAMFNTGK